MVSGKIDMRHWICLLSLCQLFFLFFLCIANTVCWMPKITCHVVCIHSADCLNLFYFRILFLKYVSVEPGSLELSVLRPTGCVLFLLHFGFFCNAVFVWISTYVAVFSNCRTVSCRQSIFFYYSIFLKCRGVKKPRHSIYLLCNWITITRGFGE